MSATQSLADSETNYIVKERIWNALSYDPHNGQRLIHESTARHRVADCGRRWGKSVMGGNELIPEALKTYTMLSELRKSGKRREFWIVGPEYSDSEKEFRVFWDAAIRLDLPFDHPGSYNNPEGSMIGSLWGGKFLVHAKSAKYPSTLVGEGLAGAIMSEAAKLKSIVWAKYIRPALADERGWSLHTSTPEGKNHFYDKYMRGLDPENKDWASWRMPSWTNNRIFPGGKNDPEIIDMAADMTEERFKQEIGADFSEFVGRVFAAFEEEVHVRRLKYDPSLQTFLATDYGWTNPFVALVIQVDVWDNVYVLGEFRVNQMDINDIGKELQTWRSGLARQATKLYPDPAEPGDTAILASALHLVPQKNTGGEIKWRLELIRQALRPMPLHAPEEERVPKLLIDFSCTELIREMNEYRYPDTKEEQDKENPENPLKKDDHAPEALGRFFRGYFGAPAQHSKQTRVSKARINR